MPSHKLLAGPFNHLSACRHGYLLYNIHDIYMGKSLDLYGEFSEGEIELCGQLLRPGDIAVDVGASIGTHSLSFARAVGPAGKVFAFEPQRILFQVLCANMALNSISNAFCYQAAVGELPASVAVPLMDYESDNNFGAVRPSSGPGETVPVLTVDGLDLPGCRLLKVDVEGTELAVLKGARQTIERYKPALYVENDRPDQSEELMHFIAQLGYQMYWHLPPLYNPANYFGNGENVFGGTVSINLLCAHPDFRMAFHGFQPALPGDKPPL